MMADEVAPTTIGEYVLWLQGRASVARAQQSCHGCNGDARELYAEEHAYREALRALLAVLAGKNLIGG